MLSVLPSKPEFHLIGSSPVTLGFGRNEDAAADGLHP